MENDHTSIAALVIYTSPTATKFTPQVVATTLDELPALPDAQLVNNSWQLQWFHGRQDWRSPKFDPLKTCDVALV
jgi:hypothetical protein